MKAVSRNVRVVDRGICSTVHCLWFFGPWSDSPKQALDAVKEHLAEFPDHEVAVETKTIINMKVTGGEEPANGRTF